MRSTNKQLEALVTILNATVPGADFSINHMVGIGYRLCRKKESVDVSPRLKLGELVQWIHAFLDGLEYCKLQGGKQNYTITLTGMRRLPNYETIQRMLREAENDDSLTIVRIARLSPGCDYTAPGEYEIGVRSNDTTYTAIIRLSNR